jgi:hypothetical protein
MYAVQLMLHPLHSILLLLFTVLQAASFRLSAERVFTPLVTLAIIIQRYPDVAQ